MTTLSYKTTAVCLVFIHIALAHHVTAILPPHIPSSTSNFVLPIFHNYLRLLLWAVTLVIDNTRTSLYVLTCWCGFVIDYRITQGPRNLKQLLLSLLLERVPSPNWSVCHRITYWHPRDGRNPHYLYDGMTQTDDQQQGTVYMCIVFSAILEWWFYYLDIDTASSSPVRGRPFCQSELAPLQHSQITVIFFAGV